MRLVWCDFEVDRIHCIVCLYCTHNLPTTVLLSSNTLLSSSKMPKIKNLKLAPQRRSEDLAHQIISNRIVTKKPAREVQSSSTQDRNINDAELTERSDTTNIDERMTAKILRQAREQQSEINDEFNGSAPVGKPSTRNVARVGKKSNTKTLKSISLIGQARQKDKSMSAAMIEEDSDEDDDHDEDADDQAGAVDVPIEIDAEDESAWNQFFAAPSSSSASQQQTLGDILREKLTEKKTELESHITEPLSVHAQQHQRLHPRVATMYKGVAQVLARYRSGKVPKAFKIIPRLQNWEQILYLTEPDRWSAAAMFQATKMFASNMNPTLAQRFYNLILLPRVRDDIAEYKQLNFHLYQALRKALFKPAAFMKGIVLPLAESGTCTLREAVILGSVLTKNSIPVLHSAAAMLRLAEMQEYNGSSSVFLKALMDKRYALPFRVVDAVVHHYLRFSHEKRKLPVLWHTSLLSFVENYKSDISSDQKEQLLDLLRYQSHYKMTPEIRRLLINSRCRDIEEFIVEKPSIGDKITTSESDDVVML